MKLVELPAKEKHQSLQEKRRSKSRHKVCTDAVAAGAKAPPPKKEWILVSTLSEKMKRAAKLLEPDDVEDHIYQGLVTTILSLIYCYNGVLPAGNHSSRRRD